MEARRHARLKVVVLIVQEARVTRSIVEHLEIHCIECRQPAQDKPRLEDLLDKLLLLGGWGVCQPNPDPTVVVLDLPEPHSHILCLLRVNLLLGAVNLLTLFVHRFVDVLHYFHGIIVRPCQYFLVLSVPCISGFLHGPYPFWRLSVLAHQSLLLQIFKRRLGRDGRPDERHVLHGFRIEDHRVGPLPSPAGAVGRRAPAGALGCGHSYRPSLPSRLRSRCCMDTGPRVQHCRGRRSERHRRD
mmetsp:Transcript_29509/g.83233  ORF Transcript_29509/g.83233 Transcript_29509/m.83233 type:complete len:243 (-) Transcript_29509:187-915(-)